MPGPALPPFQPFGGISQEQKVELLEYWRSVFKRRWAIAGLALAVAVLATIVAMGMTPVYRATALILVESAQRKAMPVEEVYSTNQAYEHYQTQVELLKSREVALRTAKALKLWNHPLHDPRIQRPSWSQRLLAELGIRSRHEAKTSWTEDELAAATVGVVQGGLTVTPVRLSQLIQIHVDSADRDLAARIANQHAKEYIEADRDERFKLTNQVSQQLQQRLVSLREQLTVSETALQKYREAKGIIQLSNQGTNGSGAKSLPYSTWAERLVEARAKRQDLETQYQQARAATADNLTPALIREPGMAESQRALTASQQKLASLQERLGPEHVQIKEATADVASSRASIEARLKAVVRSMQSEYEAARLNEAGIERSLQQAKTEVQGSNREEFELAVLEREYQSNRQLFELFMTRAKETNLVSDVQASVARIADRAIAPGGSIAPQKSRIVFMSILGALLLGAAAAIAIDKLDSTIKGGEDAEARLHMPVLSNLPRVEGATRKQMARALLKDNHSHFAEGIRTARTGVLLSSLDVTHRILLITSSVPGEGKTTVSINLAMAHAQTERTLLIDCDMRRAQLSGSLGLGAGHKGLTHLVSGAATAEECIVQVRDTGLSVLPVGEMPPNPLDLIISQRFRDQLASLSERYTMIILDSPPVELVSEALMLAPLATNVAVVVKAMSTPASLVRKTQQRLQRAGGKVMGVLLNDLDFKAARQYYGEYAHSTYSYSSERQIPYVGAKTKAKKPLFGALGAAVQRMLGVKSRR